MTDVGITFESRILRGVMETAYAESYHVLLLESHAQLPHTCQAINVFLEQQVAGILICSAHPDALPRTTDFAMRSHDVIPVALDYSVITGAMDRVCTDEAALGEVVVAYLRQLGHRDIAYVGPPEKGFRGERMQHIRLALQNHGLSAAYLTDWNCADQSELDADGIIADLLARNKPPTAIIGWEDRVAVRLMHAAQHRGLQVPRDISIVGCANMTLGEFTTPALTSVEQDPESIGREGCALLLSYLGSSSKPGETHTIGIAPKIVHRHSCAKPNLLLGNR